MARVWRHSYESLSDFYCETYGSSLVSLSPVGSRGAQILRAKQGAGDRSGAPNPDLVLGHAQSTRPIATVDVGAGRFQTDFRENAMWLVPPNAGTSIYVENPHEIEILAVNYESLRELCAEVALPEDGDFAALHRTEFRDSKLHFVVQSLSAEALAGNPHGPLYSEGALLTLGILLLNLTKRNVVQSRGGLATWQLRRTTEYIEARLEEPITLLELAALVRLSPFHFARAFKASTGHPPHRYHMEMRINRSKVLLRTTGLPITEIALGLGYDSPQTFARVFRQIVGCTPSDWRRDRLS
jgi:AraC family transcriptional regulator